MLKAMVSGKIIYLWQLNKTERLTLQRENHLFLCPYCQTDLIFKCGTKKQAHFAHKTKCIYEGSENESEEHYTAKKEFATWLYHHHATNIEIEALMTNIGRIADIKFEYENQIYVIEIQRSCLSDEIFQQRTKDYEKIGISVIWIFLGRVKTTTYTQQLSALMIKNKEQKLIVFDHEPKMISIYENLIWLTAKEVIPNVRQYHLNELAICDLIERRQDVLHVKKSQWMHIKQEFRVRKWFLIGKYNPLLTEVCYQHRMNLSLVPAEVGWPILNNYGVPKPLFIWQTYVLVGIIMSLEINDCFTLKEVMDKLKYHYRVNLNPKNQKKCYLEVKTYLEVLETFNIIKKNEGYYEYIKKPKRHQNLELALNDDALLFDLLVKKQNYHRMNKK